MKKIALLFIALVIVGLVFLRAARPSELPPQDITVYDEKIIAGADPLTFEQVLIVDSDQSADPCEPGDYAKDANHYYWEGQLIVGSDASSFEIMTEYWALAGYEANCDVYPLARDRENVYLSGMVLDAVEANTLRVFGPDYFTDGNVVYHGGIEGSVLVPNTDAETFERLNRWYVRDKRHIYLWGEALEGADVESFEIVSCWFARDRHAVYWEWKILALTDPTAFELLSPETTWEDCPSSVSYGKTADRAYFYGDPIVRAEASTFRVLETTAGDGTLYAVDGRALYYKGIKIADDRGNWQALAESFAKSATQVFAFGRVVPYADVASFEVTGPNRAKDKHQAYEF